MISCARVKVDNEYFYAIISGFYGKSPYTILNKNNTIHAKSPYTNLFNDNNKISPKYTIAVNKILGSSFIDVYPYICVNYFSFKK